MTICPIVRAPDPRLHAICTDVVVNTPQTHRVAAHLIDTMYAKNGRGLAAPQIGFTVRMFVMRRGPEALVMCNPVIVRHGKEVVRKEERCLSIVGVSLWVDRYRIVTVEWYDLDGVKCAAKLTGDAARCAQHEIDHLNGLLFNST